MDFLEQVCGERDDEARSATDVEKTPGKEVACPICQAKFDVSKTAYTEKDAKGDKVYFDRDSCLNKWLQLNPGG